MPSLRAWSNAFYGFIENHDRQVQHVLIVNSDNQQQDFP
jgi:hypothetical protein